MHQAWAVANERRRVLAAQHLSQRLNLADHPVADDGPFRSKSSRQRHSRRHAIGDRDGWLCVYCDRKVECASCDPCTSTPATLDHVVPRSRGGNAMGRANLVTACGSCNQNKADRLLDEVKRGQGNVIVRAQNPPKARRPGCRKTRSGTVRKPFRTAAEALLMCAAVEHTHGKMMGAYRCVRCKQWHIGAAFHVEQAVARGVGDEYLTTSMLHLAS